jgi:hypothetical protein
MDMDPGGPKKCGSGSGSATLLLRAEGFSSNLEVLYRDLAISKLLVQFLIKKKKKIFTVVFVF